MILNVPVLTCQHVVSCVLNCLLGYHSYIILPVYFHACVFISFICCIFMNVVLPLEALWLLTVCSFATVWFGSNLFL